MPSPASLSLRNGQAAALANVPLLSAEEFRSRVINGVRKGARLAAFFGQPQSNGEVRLIAILADGSTSSLAPLAADVKESYPALTPDCPQAHWFEREIAEQWGVRPEGHPWLKPIRSGGICRVPISDDRFPHLDPLPQTTGERKVSSPRLRGEGQGEGLFRTDFFRVEGEEVHEVAVGPIHAGVLEPGHFRFQCHGENVLHLEISLGYQHRGVERALVGGPTKRTIHYMETLSGDTTVGHAIAHCQAVEALAGFAVPARAQALRGIALELERLANHTGDLGALANDVGYLPTASYCGRIRGDFLNMTALLCGSRLGRGMVRPGGVRFDADAARAGDLLQRLERALRDVTVAANLLWSTSSVRARFENTGTVPRQTCIDLGLVGPPARACGVERDVRSEFPSGVYQFFQVPVSTSHTGDVFARSYVRWLEIQRSVAFARDMLKALRAGPTVAQIGPLAPHSIAVSLVEGWRGEICHVAMTDERGQFTRYKIVDPSFHNWIGLAMALRGQPISDFPLCNKSFNLSYCGHDL